MAKFCPLFSSSSGNSVYIGSSGGNLLFDVGRSAKQTVGMLENIGVAPEELSAVVLTHEHSDHVRGLSVFAAKYDLPVYASAGTLSALRRSGVLTGKHVDRVIDDDGLEIGGMFVKPFRISHDCCDGRGFTITTEDGTRVAVATDMGFVSGEILSALTGCMLVYIESNHDIAMLREGPYPQSLQKRILSKIGHLSNDACAKALTALVNNGTTRVVLAHLSEKNNTPRLAYDTAVSALSEIGALPGRDYLLSVAEPVNSGKPIYF